MGCLKANFIQIEPLFDQQMKIYNIPFSKKFLVNTENQTFFQKQECDFQPFFHCRWDFASNTQMCRHMKHKIAKRDNIKLIFPSQK